MGTPALYRCYADKRCAERLARTRAAHGDDLLALAETYVGPPAFPRLAYCSPLSRNRLDPVTEQHGAEQLRRACGGDRFNRNSPTVGTGRADVERRLTRS